ncbi:hypothetical protein Rsub_11017 [Raphidocelis subcapitata]|uniref:Cysteine-rich PDZ-binding protein n=1 Tax=Raphidocelis subcapitata TaxID=307507 RepID=A0A2V0PHH8_9CHLO|nr:hypothetical protein Rsub_11017 [Raphidocelis subcapitata]|eukprot:GBF97370.1 hypothetical protein Rsub_11017 [Raphidocelis subcapitata]
MVCGKCEKKLTKVAPPEKWKDGGDDKRKVNQNKLLNKDKRFTPYGKSAKCKICKQQVHSGDGMYCHNCAYSKGVCAMCGVQILDTKSYKQSAK